MQWFCQLPESSISSTCAPTPAKIRSFDSAIHLSLNFSTTLQKQLYFHFFKQKVINFFIFYFFTNFREIEFFVCYVFKIRFTRKKWVEKDKKENLRPIKMKPQKHESPSNLIHFQSLRKRKTKTRLQNARLKNAKLIPLTTKQNKFKLLKVKYKQFNLLRPTSHYFNFPKIF